MNNWWNSLEVICNEMVVKFWTCRDFFCRYIISRKCGKCFNMTTSSNGSIFRVTGPLCGEFTGPGEFPTQRPVTRSFDVFFDLCLNKRLNKQPRGWWFGTPSWSLWRQCNEFDDAIMQFDTWEHWRGLTKWIYRIHHWDPFYKHGITLILPWINNNMCGMKALIHSRTSTVQPLMFGDRWIISPNALWWT